MPFPIDLTRCLAFAEADTPQRVCAIPLQKLRAKLDARGLHEGDDIFVEPAGEGHVLVTTRDGTRLVVERHYAVMIEVEPRLIPGIAASSARRGIRRARVTSGV